MATFAEIIKKKQKEWDCPDLMDRSHKSRGERIPFSSPLMNYATYGGIPRGRVIEYFGPEGGGKAQPLDSHILTPNGWIEMRDAQIGQLIFDGKGNVCKIDGVFPQGVKSVYRITFSDRTSIRVSESHLNVCWRRNYKRKSREDFCVETLELINLFNSVDDSDHSKLRVDLPVIDWPEQTVKIDPYLLGIILGDGCTVSDNFSISSAESDIISKVQMILERDWGCTLVYSGQPSVDYNIQNIEKWYPNKYYFDNHSFNTESSLLDYLVFKGYPRIDRSTIYKCISRDAKYILNKYPELSTIKIEKNPPSGRNRLISALKEYKLISKSVDKHIPLEYLYNSYDVRLQLLQGLYDTDGYTSKHNPAHGTRGSESVYSTSSAQLSDDFAFLVRSLGIRDTVVCNKSSYFQNDVKIECNDSYSHYIKVPNELKFFTSNKHKSRYKDRQNPPFRNIVNIEYIGDEECQCIHVDSEFHTYITDYFTPTHNTTTAVDNCKHAYKLFQKEYEDQVSELRILVVQDKKKYAGQLDDLLERGPKKVLYVDLENSFDDEWCKTIGLNPNEIEIMTTPNVVAEDILQTIQELIETGEVGLIVLDSIPSLVPRTELEKKYGERTVAALAGLLSVFYRKIVPLLTRYDCTFIGINQIRDNMDNPYVLNTPGGRAPKFYASLRIQFQIGKPVDFLGNELAMNAENPAGYIVNAKIIKQKSAPNDRRLGTYYLMVHSGIREDFDFAKLAVDKYGIIRKSGGWFTICDPETGEILEKENGAPLKINGMAKVYEFLKDSVDYYEKLKKFILDDINGVDSDNLPEDDISESESNLEINSSNLEN